MSVKRRSFDKAKGRDIKSRPLWWFIQLLFTAGSLFFVFFGISLLMAAYRLTDPFSFIMTFFAASLIIMISVVMAMGFVVRMRRVMRTDHGATRADPTDSDGSI